MKLTHKKTYYNCCSYITEYGEVDKQLIAVYNRTTPDGYIFYELFEKHDQKEILDYQLLKSDRTNLRFNKISVYEFDGYNKVDLGEWYLLFLN